MPSERRLLRRKKRLTCRITHRDNRWLAREAKRIKRGRAPRVDPETGLPAIPRRTVLRAAIWKVDELLEQERRIGDGAAMVR